MTLKLSSLTRLFKSQTSWLERQQNTILSAATIITVFNIISALAGIVRNRYFILVFNDTSVASKSALNALFVAFQIPDMLFQLVVFGAMSAAFVPMFISVKKQDQAAAFKMTSILMTTLMSVFALLSLLVFYFAKEITLLRTGTQFSSEQIEIVTNLTKIMLLGQFFLGISSFFGSILNAYQRFVIPALAPILYNLGVLLGVYFLADRFGIYSAGLGVIIGAFIHMMVQLPFVWKLGFRFIPSFNLNYPGVKTFFALTPPRIAAISVAELRDLLLGFFVTSIAYANGMTIMQLALSIMVAPIRFFGIPISQAALPFLSEEVSKHDHTKLKELILQSLNQIAFLILPASVLILILRIPIVRLLYGVANLPWPMTVLTGKVVAIISLSIAVQGLTQLLVRAFYALKDTKTPFLVALSDIFFYTILCSVLVFGFKTDLLGLAWATTITAFLELIMILFFLDRRLKCFGQKAFLLPQAKMLTASFLMAVFLYLPFRILDELVFDTSHTIELIALTITTSTIGLLVYLYFAALLEIRELKFFLSAWSSFDKWRKSLAKSPEILAEANVESDNI